MLQQEVLDVFSFLSIVAHDVDGVLAALRDGLKVDVVLNELLFHVNQLVLHVSRRGYGIFPKINDDHHIFKKVFTRMLRRLVYPTLVISFIQLFVTF